MPKDGNWRGRNIRRGKKEAAAQRRIEREAGNKGLDDVLRRAEGERPGQVAENVQKFFEHSRDEKPKPWETEGKGFGPDGEFLTLEDLIYLKPFTMEDMNSTVAFRANDKMMRAFQRLREASGGVYDIMSDLYRDAATIGLLVLSERHRSILGLEIVISRAENHQLLKEEAADYVLRLKEALRPLDTAMKKSHFRQYMENLSERPRWYQEIHIEEMKTDKSLSSLLSEMEEDES